MQQNILSAFGNSMLCYTELRLKPALHLFSNASFNVEGGFCSERKVYWRYDLDAFLSNSLRDFAARLQASDVTINLLDLCKMFVTARCLIVCEQDSPAHEGNPILIRADNVSAVSWVNR